MNIYILTVQNPDDFSADWDIKLVTTNYSAIAERLANMDSNCVVEQWANEQYVSRVHYVFNRAGWGL